MESPHILHDFDEAIRSLRGEVLEMAGKARHNLERAVRALLDRNEELANAVIAEDDEVDEHERHIDQLGMQILVRFHPMATDLRLVVSSMKISMNLERISDHATNIAKRARKISGGPEMPDASLIEPIYTMADQLLRDAVTAYNDQNVQLGSDLHNRDKELDRLYKQATASFGSRIEESTGRGQDYLHLILVLRSLERVGDLAVNIGEDAVFLGAAKDLRHKEGRPPRPDDAV
ncbi:MAG: phosphate signaling complex protein PhoU [Verrucomicrobia bacterium]|jgi:phosphate transport system protein|nr:phosphate signaling complex protein PhoU [Verrucomicrobiota bacterium]